MSGVCPVRESCPLAHKSQQTRHSSDNFVWKRFDETFSFYPGHPGYFRRLWCCLEYLGFSVVRGNLVLLDSRLDILS